MDIFSDITVNATTFLEVPKGWVIAPIDLSAVGGPRFNVVALCSFECAAKYLDSVREQHGRLILDTSHIWKAQHR